jgi:ribosomal protein L14
MIYKESVIDIIDNCGARKGKCIAIVGTRCWAKVGDLIRIVLRRFFNTTKKIKKGEIYLGVIISVAF